jgi:hypothetical protein
MAANLKLEVMSQMALGGNMGQKMRHIAEDWLSGAHHALEFRSLHLS